MDTVSRIKRSFIMSRVRSSGNKSTEKVFIKILRKYKIAGWRRHYHAIGKPDFVFLKYRLAVFIDGCFWHKCPQHCRIPKNNKRYWVRKITLNAKRDKQITQYLRAKGWMVFRFWEHELKGGAAFSRKINRIKRTVQ